MLGGGTQLGVGSQQLGAATQEQLESLYKQLGANSGSGLGAIGGGGSGTSGDQAESLQKHIFEKQMLALLEQQKLSASIPIPGLVGTTPTNLAALSQATPTAMVTGTTTSTSPAPSISPGGAEIFQMPPSLFLLNLANQGASPFGPLATSSTSPAAISSATPTLTSSTTPSNNAGLSATNLGQLGLANLPLQPSGLSLAAREPLSLVPGGGAGAVGGAATGGGLQQRRPLSESLSAPGFQTGQEQPNLDTLQKQYQLQHQQLLSQSHQIHQHYLDQQQRSEVGRGCERIWEERSGSFQGVVPSSRSGQYFCLRMFVCCFK